MHATLARYLTPGSLFLALGSIAGMLLLGLKLQTYPASNLLMASLVIVITSAALWLQARLWEISDLLDDICGTAELGSPQEHEIQALRTRAEAYTTLHQASVLQLIEHLEQAQALQLSPQQGNLLTANLNLYINRWRMLLAGFTASTALLGLCLSAWHSVANLAATASVLEPALFGLSGAACLSLALALNKQVCLTFQTQLAIWLDRVTEVESAPNSEHSGIESNTDVLRHELQQLHKGQLAATRILESHIDRAIQRLHTQLSAQSSQSRPAGTEGADNRKPLGEQELVLQPAQIDDLARQLRGSLVEMMLQDDDTATGLPDIMLPLEASNDEELIDDQRSA